jgi:hypothetical protein
MRRRMAAEELADIERLDAKLKAMKAELKAAQRDGHVVDSDRDQRLGMLRCHDSWVSGRGWTSAPGISYRQGTDGSLRRRPRRSGCVGAFLPISTFIVRRIERPLRESGSWPAEFTTPMGE